MENSQNYFLKIVTSKAVTAYEFECTRNAGFDFFAMADRVYGSEMHSSYGYKSPFLCLCRPDGAIILVMGIYSNNFDSLVDALNTNFKLRFKEKAITNPTEIKKIFDLL